MAAACSRHHDDDDGERPLLHLRPVQRIFIIVQDDISINLHVYSHPEVLVNEKPLAGLSGLKKPISHPDNESVEYITLSMSKYSATIYGVSK